MHPLTPPRASGGVNGGANLKSLSQLSPQNYAKGKRLYTSFYEHFNHEKVADAIKSSSHKHWIVTYDNVDQIEEIYNLTNKTIYNLKYSLSHQSTGGSELLFYSKHINLPYHPNKKSSDASQYI